MQTNSTQREIQVTTLPNGLRVITEFMPGVRSVSTGIWIVSGSRRETAEFSGISHFIEHMLFKGTATRSAEGIAREMDALGGHLDAFTGKELVSLNAKVLDDHLPIAMDVLSDMVLNPAFRDDDISREKGVILEELKMEADNPEYVVHESFISSFWKGHPLGQSIIGTGDTIRSFSRGMVGEYWGSVYTPANVIVTAAGSVKHEQLVELVNRHFRDVPAGLKLEEQPAPQPSATILIQRKKSLEQVHLIMGMPAFPTGHEQRFVAYTLNTLLGGSMSSRLFQSIREQRGLVYNVFSEISAYRDTGCLCVYAGTSRESVVQLVGLVCEEFRRFKHELVSEEELLRAKSHLKGSLMLSLESTGARMTNLARQQIYFGRFPSIDETLESIERVTAEDLRIVAREFFDADRIGVAVLGPVNGIRLGRKHLLC
jgi:predicted Zn-dependent peptidase